MLPIYPHHRLKVLLIAFMIPLSGMAADNEDLRPACISQPEEPEISQVSNISTGGNAKIKANKAEIRKDRTTQFSGNVRFEQLGRRITSDVLLYNKKLETVQAKGKVVYQTNLGEKINTDSLHYDKKSGTLEAHGESEFTSRHGDRFYGSELRYQSELGKGNIKNSRYFLYEPRQAHGSALSVDFKDKVRTVLSDVSYTTCDSKKPAWVLKAGTLELDREKDIGIARNVTVRIKGVPVFYWPYLDFPLSGQRKSGFLAPSFGSSKLSGVFFALPYYFNLAPNLDNTLTPQWFGKRGWQLRNQFRYLGKRYRGQLDLEALPGDKVANENRASVRFDHKYAFSENLRLKTHVDWVSDAQYQTDFSGSLAKSSNTHTSQNIDMEYSGKNWQLMARVQNYQIIDDSLVTTEPYKLVPQLRLTSRYPFAASSLNANLKTEWSVFDRDTGPRGSRLRINPFFNYPWKKDYAFVIPTIGGHYWQYDLSDSGGLDPQPSAAVSYASLDAGLIFERHTDNMIQTLEPRFYYLRTSSKNQDGLPLFDTEKSEFRYERLFAANRFVGGDRVGDANQVAVGLTSRFLNKNTGQEYGHLSLGGIRYFDDREVSLSMVTETTNKSDLAAEWAIQVPKKWYLQHHLQWDADARETKRSYAYLQFHLAEKTYARISYRAERGQERQIDAAFKWQLSPGWAVLALQRYDLMTETNVESVAGVEHHSCCWALRLSASQRLTQSGQEEQKWMLQFALLGLFDLEKMNFDPLSRKLLD